MTSRATICLYRLRHTAVAAAAPAMTSRATICLYCLRHTAVAAAAPAMMSRGTIYLYRLRHYSGRSGGPGYDIPCSPPQYSGSHSYRAKPFVRRYSGGDGTALSPQHQPAPRPFSSFVRDQRYNSGHSAAPPQQPAPRPFSSFVRDQRYNGGHNTAPPQQLAPRPFSIFGWDQRYNGGHSTAPHQQPRPRPFSSFGWDQRYACHSRPPVNAVLANNIAEGQAQRDVGGRPSRATTAYDGNRLSWWTCSRGVRTPGGNRIVGKRGAPFTGTPPATAAPTQRDPLTASRRYLGLGL